MTYLDMCKEVILTGRSPKGMSLQAIKKGVAALKGEEAFNGKLVTKALKQGVEDGIFTQGEGQRVKITPEQRKELKKGSPKKAKSPSPKKASKPKKKSTAPKTTKPKKAKASKGPAGAAKAKTKASKKK